MKAVPEEVRSPALLLSGCFAGGWGAFCAALDGWACPTLTRLALETTATDWKLPWEETMLNGRSSPPWLELKL